MPSIAIVTDTDSSLPADVAAEYGIRQVPISVQFGQTSFLTGEGIDDAQLFARIDREGVLPTTAAPSPGQFSEAYRASFEAGADSVVCICVSSAVSGTYESALLARELLLERDITVVDSQSLSMGQGFMVLSAARAARAGATRESVVARAENVCERTHLFAALSTLKYLAMSGRVGHLAAGMAGLLRIMPILTIQEGKLDLLERVRTRKRAWSRLIALVAEAARGKPIEQMALLHVNAEDEAMAFGEELRVSVPCPEATIVAPLTPGLSVHSGAGLVGVTIVVAE